MVKKAVVQHKPTLAKDKKAVKAKPKTAVKLIKKKLGEVKVKAREVARKAVPKAKAVRGPGISKKTTIGRRKETAILEAKPVLERAVEEIRPVVIPRQPTKEVKPAEEKKFPHPVVKELIVEKEKRPVSVAVKKIVEEKKVVSPPPVPKPRELQSLELNLPITVKDLSIKLQDKPSSLIKRLMDKGIMVGINQTLEEPTVVDICNSYGFEIKKAPDEEEMALSIHQEKDLPHLLKTRAPAVTLMGHVDHGKTSLLDAIRKSKLAQLEFGGITQHIGAYKVILPKGSITFLDTPGHEAFTAMRVRGARITDIVVLVVAADDGVMPQTVEAVDHAREANVPIIVAINKIDKPQANIDKVKKQLSELNLKPEDWQGTTITVPVSAKNNQGIDELLEMILLQAEIMELKANYDKPARGVVIESKLNKGRGYVSTLLIQNGILHLNDNIIVGKFYGKIKAMFDDCGRPLTEAGPSTPVEVLGIAGVPEGGAQFFAVEDERKARSIAAARQEREKIAQVKTVKRISLEELYAEIKEGKVKELKVILKADVKGSLEAIKESFNRLEISEIKLNIIHEGTGPINVSDVILASASNALILGFHVESDEKAKELIPKEGIDVRTYNIIYELSDDLKNALEGLLEPEIKKIFLGRAEVKKIFRLSRSGTIAGCSVVKGKITRNADVSLVRNGQVVFEGKVSSLKRFKDDVRDVAEGFECGLSIGGFEDLKDGDIIEAYEIKKIARKL
jgi:translation initiation factor IF-2